MLARMPDGTAARRGAAAKRFTVERAPADLAGRRAFAARVVAHLARHEAENNLPIGVANSVADGLYTGDDVELLLAVDAAGETRAALVMTPPHHLLVAYGDDEDARATLLADMRSRGAVPPGVTGIEPDAAAVARWWAEGEGLAVRQGMRQGVYRLSRVLPAARAPGSVRVATAGDAALVVPWFEAFYAEVNVHIRSPEEAFRLFIGHEYRRLYLFEVGGEPVSLAGLGARTPHGRRIGPVYTPPPFRRRSYAESLVASVSEGVLAAGYRFCFLYTDLANPTSNPLYERIGYERIAESAEYGLVRPGG